MSFLSCAPRSEPRDWGEVWLTSVWCLFCPVLPSGSGISVMGPLVPLWVGLRLCVCSVAHTRGYTGGSWCLLCSVHLRYPIRGGTWVVAVASLSSQPSEYRVTRDRRIRGTQPEPSQEQPRLAWLWPDPACPPPGPSRPGGEGLVLS